MVTSVPEEGILHGHTGHGTSFSSRITEIGSSSVLKMPLRVSILRLSDKRGLFDISGWNDPIPERDEWCMTAMHVLLLVDRKPGSRLPAI